MIRIDLNKRTCNVLVPDDEWEKRKLGPLPKINESQTPWQEIFRTTVNQLSEGMVMKPAIKFKHISSVIPRHNH